MTSFPGSQNLSHKIAPKNRKASAEPPARSGLYPHLLRREQDTRLFLEQTQSPPNAAVENLHGPASLSSLLPAQGPRSARPPTRRTLGARPGGSRRAVRVSGRGGGSPASSTAQPWPAPIGAPAAKPRNGGGAPVCSRLLPIHKVSLGPNSLR